MVSSRSVERVLVRFGVAVPVLYFGTQLAIGLATRGYSFRAQAASDLGAGQSTGAALFNLGAMVTGGAALLAAYGVARAPGWTPRSTALCWLTALAVASTGAAALAAGLFPLPDDRHGGGPIGAGMFVLPLLVVLLLWRRAGRWLRLYLVLNLLAFVGGGAMLSGATPIDEVANAGLLQRLFALTVFGAIGVVSLALDPSRRGRQGTGGPTAGGC